MKIKCPQCKKKSEYNKENSYRPFCSERCKMIDLGQWANEEFAIAKHDLSENEVMELEEALEKSNQFKN